MNTLTEPIKEWAFYDDIRVMLGDKGKGRRIAVSGCVDSQKIHLAEALCEGFKNKIYVTHSDQRVAEIAADLSLYGRNVYIYPARDLIFYQVDIQGNRLLEDRLRVMRRIVKGAGISLVTTFNGLMTLGPKLECYRDNIISLEKGQSLSEEELAKRLVANGYVRNYQAETPGQFSVRGGILDIFDLTGDNPVRIELWGDEIDSIRSFDAESQRSIEMLESVDIFPASELILDEEQLMGGLQKIESEGSKLAESLFKEFKTAESARIKDSLVNLREELIELGRLTNLDRYLHFFYDKSQTVTLPQLFGAGEAAMVLDEPARLRESGDIYFEEYSQSMSNRLEKGYIIPTEATVMLNTAETMGRVELAGIPVLSVSTFEEKESLFAPDYRATIEARSIAPYKGHFELLVKDLRKYKQQGFRIVLLSASGTKAARMAKDLVDNDLWAITTQDMCRSLVAGEITCMKGLLSKGFEYPGLKLVIVGEGDIFDIRLHKKRKRHKGSGSIRDFGELKIGDYVVHERHGMGVYKGIEKLEIEKVTRDYIKLEYAGGGLLYILPSNLEVLQKYGSGDMDKKPKINKLGSKEWTNTKNKVKEAVDQVASDLVELYAARQMQEGYSFGSDTVWQKEFEELFPYEETIDQLNAVDEIKRDMESPHIMDRLVCGDVGYGKTEVAIRAAFKAVTDSKQVAVLVPTTILAGQHYNTFVQRMKDFPIKIEILSRFRTAAQQKAVIDGLRKGSIDVVIGTHRLLSADVSFKDLGLLIVDEEQRFGVSHKEKIKKLKENVDVLTLTATPIPRTLHMSLVGIRDMSVLEEPPGERLPIQTFVCEYNEEMVREAITRELSRGGQIYYVYNRIDTIADIAASIQKLVPNANVEYAHGRMKESRLENIMMDFVSGDIDVLVSTTIIETGLDIPNVNTIIIHDSDRMGLSQLYQLRGRVGRSGRTAFAFLMYKRDKMLKEVAEKRLEAIKEFTDLGSGYKIAMRDLELRGAGNLLGRKQHGHLEAVGYELYCKMLNEAVSRLKGIEKSEGDFDTQVDIDVNAYIPGEYVMNEVQKLDIYKRIASMETESEVKDMREELEDRFGQLPESAANLLEIAGIKNLAHSRYITQIKGGDGRIKVSFMDNAPLKTEGIATVMLKMGKALRFAPGGEQAFVCTYEKTGIASVDSNNLMEQVKKLMEYITEYM